MIKLKEKDNLVKWLSFFCFKDIYLYKSRFMKLENILNKILLEKDGPLDRKDTDPETTDADVKAYGLESDIKKRLSKYMTVYDDEDFFTLGRLSMEPFGIEFNIIESEGDDENLILPEVVNIKGLARVENARKTACDKSTWYDSFLTTAGRECFDLEGNGNLILRVKVDNHENIDFLSLMFNAQDIIRNYETTQKKDNSGPATLRGLFQDKNYRVMIGGDLSGVSQVSSNGGGGQGGGPNSSGGSGSSYTPPSNFLTSSKYVQLAYLTLLFSDDNKDIWSLLGLKPWSPLTDGFVNAIINKNTKNLGVIFDTLLKENSFLAKNIDASKKDEWINSVSNDKNIQNVILWIRTTRKNNKKFIDRLKNLFPEFEVGELSKKKAIKPGEKGKKAETKPLNQSILTRYDLISESDLKSFQNLLPITADLSIFKAKFTEFMELLSLMYDLEYNRENVYNSCKGSGCKPIKSKEEKVEESINQIMKLLVEQKGPNSVAKIYLKELDVDVKENVKTGGRSKKSGGTNTLKGTDITWSELSRLLGGGKTIKGGMELEKDTSFSDSKYDLTKRYFKNGLVEFKLAKGDDKTLIAAIDDTSKKYMKIKINSGDLEGITAKDVTIRGCVDGDCTNDLSEDWQTGIKMEFIK